MNAVHPSPEGVGPKDLADQVEEKHDRGLAPEKPRFGPYGSARVEAPDYPPLCAHGMNSLTDKGYDVALERLRRG
jgi:hypothetical protein